MSKYLKPIIFLMGPTASGKTALAMELIKHYPLEIISVDSAMIYQGMDIGTGKPTKEELQVAPHHLIDICDPAESYSAAQFRQDALKLIDEIHRREKIPLLVGGTMMYFNALKHGMSTLPSANQEIRKKLLQEKDTLGVEKLHDRLQKIDPQSAKRIHPNDPQRLLRALEVYELTGIPMSEHFEQESSAQLPFKLIEIAISPKERLELHHRIATRFENMLEQGFIEEVKKLKARKDLTLNLPAIRSVGYRQIWQYLDNEYDAETMKQTAIAATRQLAKRQLTWLRSWEGLQWFESDDPNLIIPVLHFLNKVLDPI